MNIIDSEGRKRYPFPCSGCGETVFRQLKQRKRFGKSWCTKCKGNCGIASTVKVKCTHCGKKLWRKPSEIRTAESFCSNSHKVSYYNTFRKNEESKYTYRTRALETYGEKCSNKDCELTRAGIEIAKQMLDADHIDGNRSNNAISNLQVLCVWCHAKKTRSNFGR